MDNSEFKFTVGDTFARMFAEAVFINTITRIGTDGHLYFHCVAASIPDAPEEYAHYRELHPIHKTSVMLPDFMPEYLGNIFTEKSASPKGCTCEIFSLMNQGCQCGGI